MYPLIFIYIFILIYVNLTYDTYEYIYIHMNTQKHHVAAWVRSFSIFSEPTSPYTQIDHLPRQSSCTHAYERKRRPGHEGCMAVRIRQAHAWSTLAHQQGFKNQNHPAVSCCIQPIRNLPNSSKLF